MRMVRGKFGFKHILKCVIEELLYNPSKLCHVFTDNTLLQVLSNDSRADDSPEEDMYQPKVQSM